MSWGDSPMKVGWNRDEEAYREIMRNAAIRDAKRCEQAIHDPKNQSLVYNGKTAAEWADIADERRYELAAALGEWAFASGEKECEVMGHINELKRGVLECATIARVLAFAKRRRAKK